MSVAKELQKITDALFDVLDKQTKAIKILRDLFKDLRGRMLLVEKEINKIKRGIK